MPFLQNHKGHRYVPFLGGKTHQWIKFLAKARKTYFGGTFGLFAKMTIFLKNSAPPVLDT